MPMNHMILIFLAAMTIFVVLAIYIYIKVQGDELVKTLVEKRTTLICEVKDENKAVFSVEIPFTNIGKQEGIITDAFVRVLLPKEQYDTAFVTSFLENSADRRDDNYFAAYIVEKKSNDNFFLTLIFTAKEDTTIEDAMADMVDFTVDIYFVAMGRTAPRINKTWITIPLEEVQKAFNEGGVK